MRHLQNSSGYAAQTDYEAPVSSPESNVIQPLCDICDVERQDHFCKEHIALKNGIKHLIWLNKHASAGSNVP